jgi:hypothetical protein
VSGDSGNHNCRVEDCGASTDGFLCRSCLRTLERAIGDMTSLMHEASVVATRQARVYRASASAQQPQEEAVDVEAHLPAWLRSKDGRVALRPSQIPVDLDAADLLWASGNTLSTWVRHICESRGVDAPNAAGMVAFLLTNVETFRWDEAGPQAHEEITGLHWDLEHLVDRSPSRVYAGPCTTAGCTQATADGEQAPTDLYAPWRPSNGAEGDRDDQDDKEFTCDGHRSPGPGCGETYTWGSRRP